MDRSLIENWIMKGCNIIVFLDRTRDGNFSMGNTGFYLYCKSTFHMNKAFTTGISLFSHLMLMMQNFDSVWFKLP